MTKESRLPSMFVNWVLSISGCVIFALLVISGCHEKSTGIEVQGAVTYRDEPLTKAAITFFPSAGRPVSAALSEQGEYNVELPPGEYVVTVNVGAELPPGFKEGDPLPPPKLVLPPEYTTRAKSKLTATVREGEPQTTDFPLE